MSKEHQYDDEASDIVDKQDLDDVKPTGNYRKDKRTERSRNYKANPEAYTKTPSDHSDKPSWQRPGAVMADILAARILEQAGKAGIETDVYGLQITQSELVSTITKFADSFPDLMGLLIEQDPSAIIGKGKSILPWVEAVVAPRFGLKPDVFPVAAEKQNALWIMKTSPNPTDMAKNYTFPELVEKGEKIRLAMRAAHGWHESNFREELTAEWNHYKVHGHKNPLFVLGHMMVVAGVMKLPVSPSRDGTVKDIFGAPRSAYIAGAKQVQQELFWTSKSYMLPAHLLPGVSNASSDYLDGYGVIKIGNSQGAAGYPRTNMANARASTSDGGSPNKSNTIKSDVEDIRAWLLAGQPWNGPLWDRLQQPNTVHSRDDATVDVRILALADALRKAGYPLLAMLLPGRGIVIVSSMHTLLESIFGQPFQQWLAVKDVKSFDQRTRRFTKGRMRNFVEMTTSGRLRVAGVDVSKWDLSMFLTELAMESSILQSGYRDGIVELLVGSASRPMLVSREEVQAFTERLGPGETHTFSVVVPDDKGAHVEEVEISKVLVDIRKLIAQVTQMVNGNGIGMGGFHLKGKLRRVDMYPEVAARFGNGNDALYAEQIDHRTDRDDYLWIGGARRSGSIVTSTGNGISNGVKSHGGTHILANPHKYKNYLKKLSEKHMLPQIVRASGGEDTQSVRRGDDEVYGTNLQVVGIVDGKETDLGLDVIAAWNATVMGKYANAAKQKTGDYGRPEFEFSSKVYDEVFPHGLTPPERTENRNNTSEGTGIHLEITPLVEEEEEMRLDVVSTTLTAKARLAPQMGGPQGDATPGARVMVVENAIRDKYGLTYDRMDLSNAEFEERLKTEARRYVRREVRKHSQHELEHAAIADEYLRSEIHSLLRATSKDSTIPNVWKAGKNGTFSRWYDDLVLSLMDESK